MKLTVLIPVFNTHPADLIEAVYSVIYQDCGNIHRIILVDDGSINLETIKALRFLKDVTSAEVYEKPNGGTSDALNYGHSIADTEYIAIHGSDDISHRSRFSKQIDFIKKNPGIDVVGTNLFSFYDDDINRTPVFVSQMRADGKPPYSDKRWLACHGTVIYKKDSVIKAGGYDVAFKRAQDVDLWGRMAKQGFKFRNITETLYAWRRFR